MSEETKLSMVEAFLRFCYILRVGHDMVMMRRGVLGDFELSFVDIKVEREMRPLTWRRF